jgi:hypothetical protein
MCLGGHARILELGGIGLDWAGLKFKLDWD